VVLVASLKLEVDPCISMLIHICW